MSLSISAIIITKNEEASIKACLESISWVDEIIVVDSGSTDNTVKLSKSYGAKVYLRNWKGFGAQKNRALNLATKKWVLSIDADERVTKELRNYILSLNDHDHYAYSIKRKSSYCGTWLNYGGWGSDYVVRLFRKNAAKFSNELVHEAVITKDPVRKIHHHLLHFTYHNYEEVIKKINAYSSASALSLYSKKVKSSLFKTFLHSWWAFLKTYFFKCGFLDGKTGLLLAISNAQYTYYKYLKLSLLYQNKKH
jgi:glycosyltransferase involved in cell wall biosynthesis